jgi:hypothetical protein
MDAVLLIGAVFADEDVVIIQFLCDPCDLSSIDFHYDRVSFVEVVSVPRPCHDGSLEHDVKLENMSRSSRRYARRVGDHDRGLLTWGFVKKSWPAPV